MTAPRFALVQEARFRSSPLGLHGWADLYWQEYEELSSDWRESAVAYLLLCRRESSSSRLASAVGQDLMN